MEVLIQVFVSAISSALLPNKTNQAVLKFLSYSYFDSLPDVGNVKFTQFVVCMGKPGLALSPTSMM